MQLHNYMEEAVFDVLEGMLAEMPDVCKCEKCRLDIAALALNSLPVRYVVTERGRVYTKLTELEIQFKTDVIKEVTKAVDKVKASPQH